MEYVKGIALKHLVKLVCKKCLADLVAVVQWGKGSFEPCDACKQKCLEFKRGET